MLNNSLSSPCCYPKGEHVFWYLNAFVAILILMGNTLTCAVFLNNKRMRKEPMNMFLVSLAISGIFVAVLVIPGYSIYCMGYKRFHHESKLCCTFESIKDFAFLSTIFNVLAITLDRYIAVLKPLKYKSLMAQRCPAIILSCVWIVPTVLILPRTVCMFSTARETFQEYNKIYSYAFLFAFVFVPVVLISGVNAKIINAIKKAEHKDVQRLRSIKKLKDDESSGEDILMEGHESLMSWLRVKAELFISASTLSRLGGEEKEEKEVHCQSRARSYSQGPSTVISNDIFRQTNGKECKYNCNEEDGIDRRLRSYSTNTHEICDAQQSLYGDIASQISCKCCKLYPIQKCDGTLSHVEDVCRNLLKIRSRNHQEKHQKRHGYFLHWLHSHAKRKQLEHIRTRRYGTVSCILVIAGFVITWLPYSCLKLYQLFTGCGYVCPCLVNTSLFFLFVQSSINPLIYGFYRLDFRKATKQMLCSKRTTRIKQKYFYKE